MAIPSWTIHKFGGTSLANAERYKHVAEILAREPRDRHYGVVVSAMSKVTDALIELTQLAAGRDTTYETKLNSLLQKHHACVDELLSESRAAQMKIVFQRDGADIKEILRGIWHAKSTSDSTVELVAGYGEVWSAQILQNALAEKGHDCVWLDAREVLVVEPSRHSAIVQWEPSRSKTQDWMKARTSSFVVITGFVASTPTGVATTLKRNGSDFSASIFAHLLQAREIVIWTDVDGILSADPRLVPDAVVLNEISYNEATELAYFGAKVVHPDTMSPAIHNQIPIWIRNTFKPESRGTRISSQSNFDRPVKGFATIENLSLINVEGTGMAGVPGVAERLFGALKDVEISVIMISQASSEQSICFAVHAHDGVRARQAVTRTFEAEIQRREIQTVKLIEECSVLAMVGDGMAQTPGIAGKLFSALGKTRANVLAIAQGSSERNISTVIPKSHIHRAVRAAHSAFFLSHQTLSVGVIGTGVVGSTFLEQLTARCESLKKERGIDLRIRGIMNSKFMCTSETGINLSNWRDTIKSSEVKADLDSFARFIFDSHYPHSVIVDLTASNDTTKRYLDWLEAGLHIVTANKKAGSDDIDYYKNIQSTARKFHRHFLYETTVGAGLPVIRTLRDLVETGDELIEIEGVLSGTLSFLFNTFTGDPSFSAVVKAAKESGFTEPDPRDDLSGTDVGRKLVILAREAGLNVSRESLQIENLVPEPLRGIPVADFLSRLSELDGKMDAAYRQAKSGNEVLRYVGRVGKEGPAQVALRAVPLNHPFAHLSGSDNILLFRTRRYLDQPMVVQGPGAGPEVTAAGVFADLLRLADSLGAPQ